MKGETTTFLGNREGGDGLLAKVIFGRERVRDIMGKLPMYKLLQKQKGLL